MADIKDAQGIWQQLWYFFKIEFFIVVIINFILMGLTYFVTGVDGVEKLIESASSQYDGVSLGTTGLSICIGFIFWILFWFFGFKSKNILRAISEGLLDTIITLLRLAGGILLAFTALYLCVDGFAKVQIIFVYYGVLAIFESSCFAWLKYRMFSRPVRPIK